MLLRELFEALQTSIFALVDLIATTGHELLVDKIKEELAILIFNRQITKLPDH